MAFPIGALLASTALVGAGGVASHDGDTYVVPHHPKAGTTRFDIRDGESERVVKLRGNYSLDAISPDGSKIYVIRYLSADRAHYAVQAFEADDPAPTPVPKTVVEKGEPGEDMTGAAVSRTTNDDGSWVYTLYDGDGKEPFIHALDTVNEFTVCIDLHALEGRSDIAALDLRLRPEADELDVTAAGTPVAVVHTETFEVTNPPSPPAKSAVVQAVPEAKDGGSTPWGWIVAAVGGLVVALAATRYVQVRGADARKNPI
jgi:hypothetical protein